MKYQLRRLVLIGIVAAHAAAAQESRPGNAAQGVWFGAYVDASPCDPQFPSVPTPVGIASAISACSSAPVLYVLDFTLQGEEAVGTLTTGPPPVTGSYAAMQRVLQDKEVEIPDALELRGTVEGNSLSVATADDVIVIDARIRRDRMDATVESETTNGKQTVRVRFERCVPDAKSSRVASQCSIDALWHRLAEENAGSRLRPSSTPISRMPPSLGQQPFPTPFPSSPP